MKLSFLTKIFTFLMILLFANVVLIAQNNRQRTNPKASTAYTLPIGTVIRVRMDSQISSKTAAVGDTFTTTVIGPVFVRNVEVIPADTVFEGKIIKVVKATRKGSAGVLGIKFETIRYPNKETREIDGQIVSVKDEEEIAQENVDGNSSTVETAALIGGGAGVGAMIGGLIDGKSGALIGAAIGAGAGGIGALSNKGNEAIIKANSEIGIKLNKEVTLPAKDF